MAQAEDVGDVTDDGRDERPGEAVRRLEVVEGPALAGRRRDAADEHVAGGFNPQILAPTTNRTTSSHTGESAA